MGTPIAGSASPSVPMTDALSAGLTPPGAAQDAARQQLEGLIGQVRQVQQTVAQLGQSAPFAAQQVAQITDLLKQIIISAAQQSSAQTASGQAVPMAGGGM